MLFTDAQSRPPEVIVGWRGQLNSRAGLFASRGSVGNLFVDDGVVHAEWDPPSRTVVGERQRLLVFILGGLHLLVRKHSCRTGMDGSIMTASTSPLGR